MTFLFTKVYLRGEASVADGAFERPLFGVTAIVDLESGMASECLVANVTRRVTPHCGENKMKKILVKNCLFIKLLGR